MDQPNLGTPAAEPANFDAQLASIIERNEGGAEPKKEQARAADGRYVKVDENGYATPIEPEKPTEDKEVKAEPAKEAKAEETPAEDEEDYVEIAAEKEGEQPTRLKVTEVLDGYRKARVLETEIEGLRTAQQQMPAEIEKELTETSQARQQYLNGISALQKMLQIPEPNVAYIDPNSPNYSPETYHAQLRQAEQIKGLHANLMAEAQRVAAEQKETSDKLHNARIAREMASLLKAWPEFKDGKVQEKFVADAAREYGLTLDEMKSVTSARDYQILKDALAYRAMKAAKETAAAEAVKVVKAKPKLVRGSARQASNGKAAAYSDAMERLSKSHSDDDGLAAIRALL